MERREGYFELERERKRPNCNERERKHKKCLGAVLHLNERKSRKVDEAIVME